MAIEVKEYVGFVPKIDKNNKKVTTKKEKSEKNAEEKDAKGRQ